MYLEIRELCSICIPTTLALLCFKLIVLCIETCCIRNFPATFRFCLQSTNHSLSLSFYLLLPLTGPRPGSVPLSTPTTPIPLSNAPTRAPATERLASASAKPTTKVLHASVPSALTSAPMPVFASRKPSLPPRPDPIPLLMSHIPPPGMLRSTSGASAI